VTDAKIMMKNGRSRLFGFVGFKNDEEAKKAKEYFNGTYLHTSKLAVDVAFTQDDPNLARPWSRHSQGSSSFKREQKAHGKEEMRMKKATSAADASEVERKKQRFREFLKVMGKGQA
jgi:multiple RNA-binding domain-containing protein 1